MPFAGTTDVTDGLVTSGALDARVVNVLLKVVTGLPLKSVSPLTVTVYSVDVDRGLDGVNVTVVLVDVIVPATAGDSVMAVGPTL